MKTRGQVLLLIGSGKQPRSTSGALGGYLLERLGEQGYQTEAQLIHKSFRTEKGRNKLLAATDQVDIVVLAFPTYIDSLPASVTKALELVAKHRLGRGNRQQRLLAIANCGFPEAHHNNTALDICRLFAWDAVFSWSGGLSLGGGEALDGQPLGEAGGRARNATRALDLAAEALATGEAVPEKAVELMAKPIIPHWMYTFIGQFGWKRRARKFGTRKKLQDRPFQRVV